MTYVILIAIMVVLLLVLVRVVAGKDRYDTMTEEQFEEEAKRVSMTGVAMTELQRHLDPVHKVEYLTQRDKQVEGESAESGDPPSEDVPPGKK